MPTEPDLTIYTIPNKEDCAKLDEMYVGIERSSNLIKELDNLYRSKKGILFYRWHDGQKYGKTTRLSIDDYFITVYKNTLAVEGSVITLADQQLLFDNLEHIEANCYLQQDKMVGENSIYLLIIKNQFSISKYFIDGSLNLELENGDENIKKLKQVLAIMYRMH